MVVLQLDSINAELHKECHVTTPKNLELGCNALRCVLTVRRSTSTVGSVVESRVVLLTPDITIGQEYHRVNLGSSMKHN